MSVESTSVAVKWLGLANAPESSAAGSIVEQAVSARAIKPAAPQNPSGTILILRDSHRGNHIIKSIVDEARVVRSLHQRTASEVVARIQGHAVTAGHFDRRCV